MNEEKYRQRLDLYYLATIGYGATLIAYVMITGLWIGDQFSLVWKDPIVYLLAACTLVSLLALGIAAVVNRKVVVRDGELVFQSRFSERIIRAADLEWIALRAEPRSAARSGRAYPIVRFKIRQRRRRRRLRPGGFEQSEQLVARLREWARDNGVQLIDRRRIRRALRVDTKRPSGRESRESRESRNRE
jgi:hypothetical protein